MQLDRSLGAPAPPSRIAQCSELQGTEYVQTAAGGAGDARSVGRMWAT